jgi:hypothetical protein
MIVHGQQMTQWGQGVKSQGHIYLVGKNSFRSITERTLKPRNLKLGLMIVHDQHITPVDFLVKGSKVKVTFTL